MCKKFFAPHCVASAKMLFQPREKERHIDRKYAFHRYISVFASIISLNICCLKGYVHLSEIMKYR